jgi:hypothetical protein
VSELTPDGRSGRPDLDLHWIKSSLSFANSNCVEVASLSGGQIGVRDSKNSEGPVLRFTPGEWDAFIGGVQNGEFDHFARLWSLGAGRDHALLRLDVVEMSGEGPSPPVRDLHLLDGDVGHSHWTCTTTPRWAR